MTCSECEAAVFARGLCQKHYTRQRRSGRLHRVNAVQGSECSADGCNRKAHAGGLCGLHYQRRRGYLRTTWANLRSRALGAYPAEWDTWDVFVAEIDAILGERPSAKHQLRRPNPTIPWGAGNMVWRKPIGVGTKTPEDRARYAWLWHIRKRYGLTEDELAQLVEDQGRACPICTHALDTPDPITGKPGKICVDHDPTVSDARASVRGVIHDACNKGMGGLGDDAGNCRRAAEYLEAYATRRSQETNDG